MATRGNTGGATGRSRAGGGSCRNDHLDKSSPRTRVRVGEVEQRRFGVGPAREGLWLLELQHPTEVTIDEFSPGSSEPFVFLEQGNEQSRRPRRKQSGEIRQAKATQVQVKIKSTEFKENGSVADAMDSSLMLLVASGGPQGEDTLVAQALQLLGRQGPPSLSIVAEPGSNQGP